MSARVTAVVLAMASSAGASPLSEALARHGDAEVAALRDRRDEVAARCTLGAIYARRADLPRAALYLAGCEHAALPDDIAAAIASTARDVKRRLAASRYAALDVISHPDGLRAELDALPGESFTTPATLWVAPGRHVIRAWVAERAWTRQVTAEAHKNTLVVIEAAPGARVVEARPTQIDFVQDEGGALGEEHTGPPPDLQHPSLIQGKYRGVPEAAAERAIEDPLGARTARRRARPVWLGARFGAGLFDDSAAVARAGVALGLAGRYRITDAVFAAARADWTRRGGDAMTGTIDVLGASAGAGRTLGSGLAIIGQLRGDLRLTDQRADARVRRVGASVAVGVELALPATPLTLGLRYEQGVTELVAGARDRAVLAEVGVDLR